MLIIVPLTSAGRVVCIGESSGLSLLVLRKDDSADVVHYPLPEDVYNTEIDPQVIAILHKTGAFALPQKSLRDELVDSFFKWVAPASDQ